jgi:hypothetical protein
MRRRGWVLNLGAVLTVGLVATSAGVSSEPYFAKQWNLARIRRRQPGPGPPAPGCGSVSSVPASTSAIRTSPARWWPERTASAPPASRRNVTAHPRTTTGHGTHVAGIITTNRKGVAGVARDAQLVVAKALDANGEGSVEDTNTAIKWSTTGPGS